MPKEILDYIQTQKICVLAVEMPDGSPHAATLHFAYSDKTGEFCFMTDKESRKYESLLSKNATRASVVVGFDEANKKTFQLDGELRYVASESDQIFYKETYAGKFSKKAEACDDEENGRLIFKPTWWRFTDSTTPEGKKILLSTDK